MTGFTFAREEGRVQGVLDVLSWDIERIQSLLLQPLTLSGQESLLFELEERDSEIQTIQRVPHMKDEIHDAFESMRKQIRHIRDPLKKKIDSMKEMEWMEWEREKGEGIVSKRKRKVVGAKAMSENRKTGM